MYQKTLVQQIKRKKIVVDQPPPFGRWYFAANFWNYVLAQGSASLASALTRLVIWTLSLFQH